MYAIWKVHSPWRKKPTGLDSAAVLVATALFLWLHTAKGRLFHDITIDIRSWSVDQSLLSVNKGKLEVREGSLRESLLQSAHHSGTCWGDEDTLNCRYSCKLQGLVASVLELVWRSCLFSPRFPHDQSERNFDCKPGPANLQSVTARFWLLNQELPAPYS